MIDITISVINTRDVIDGSGIVEKQNSRIAFVCWSCYGSLTEELIYKIIKMSLTHSLTKHQKSAG